MYINYTRGIMVQWHQVRQTKAFAPFTSVARTWHETLPYINTPPAYWFGAHTSSLTFSRRRYTLCTSSTNYCKPLMMSSALNVLFLELSENGLSLYCRLNWLNYTLVYCSWVISKCTFDLSPNVASGRGKFSFSFAQYFNILQWSPGFFMSLILDHMIEQKHIWSDKICLLDHLDEWFGGCFHSLVLLNCQKSCFY